MKAARSLTGVPYPVTASQPGSAGKPVVLHPAELPLTISLNASNPPEYSQGCFEVLAPLRPRYLASGNNPVLTFKKPIGGFPAAIRASFTSAKMAAAVGVAALVPSTGRTVPFQMVLKFWPWAAMSGMPRPQALYSPAYSPPM